MVYQAFGSRPDSVRTESLCAHGVVRICGDKTVDGYRGRKVYGKARNRDAVRSTHSHTVYPYGHKWIALAVLIDLPYTGQPFALPILVALYRDKKTNTAERRRHKTPGELMYGLLATLMHWFPERKFAFAGDGGYGAHPMSRFAYRHRKRLTLVNKLIADAYLFEPPAKRQGKIGGRPPMKGKSLPKPCEVAARKIRKRLCVRWYRGNRRSVEVVSETGCWFKSGKGLVPIHWVFVRDVDGTQVDESLFSTNPQMTAAVIIENYGGRWNIETKFQELRSHLGLETTRSWSRQRCYAWHRACSACIR